jgi:hypothetical protein
MSRASKDKSSKKNSFERKMENNKINPKYVDLLEEDKPISNQKFVCVSFVSPEKIIKQKELYFFEEFLKKWEFNKSMEKFVQFLNFLSYKYNLSFEDATNDFKDFVKEEKEILSAFESHTQINSHKVFPYIASASAGLIKHFTQGYNHGITVTCPGFYGPQSRILRMPLAMPNLVDQMTSFKYGNHHIANFEMETSAIYGLCNILGHQCLSINVIVANRVKKEYSKDMGQAVNNMIQKSLAIIEKI